MKSRLGWLALLPVMALLGGGYLSQLVRPLMFGFPFLLVWNSAWVLASSGVLLLIYHHDPANRTDDE
jgi:hypothetical protein